MAQKLKHYCERKGRECSYRAGIGCRYHHLPVDRIDGLCAGDIKPGAYCQITEPWDGKTQKIGRIVSITGKVCKIKYWYDAFTGWDYVEVSKNSILLVPASRTWVVPMDEEDVSHG